MDVETNNHIAIVQQHLQVALSSADPQIIAEAWAAIEQARTESMAIAQSAQNAVMAARQIR